MEQSIKTIEDIKKTGVFSTDKYDNIMNETLRVLLENKDSFSEKNMGITDTPISPAMFLDNDTPVCLTDEVINKINNIVKVINNPDTAKEYSFLIVGKTFMDGDEKNYIIYDIIDCTKGVELSNRETNIDNDKLNIELKKAIAKGCDFISISHTHPRISEEEIRKTVAFYLPDEIREKEHIRLGGLNVSLQDLISYQKVYEWMKKHYPYVKTCQTIIMNNGEVAMLSKNDEGLLERFTEFYDLDMNSVKSIEVSRINKNEGKML